MRSSTHRTLLRFGVVVLPLLLMYGVPQHLEQQRLQDNAIWLARQQAIQAAVLAPFEQAFATNDAATVLHQCQSAINDQYTYVHPLQALAWASDRVDAYIYVSEPRFGLHRLSCSAHGIEHGRIDHPLAGLMPVEATEPTPDVGQFWSLMGQILNAAEGELRAVELLKRPDNSATLRRTIRVGPQGWQIERSSADAPDFPLLSTSPGLNVHSESSVDAEPSGLPLPAQSYPNTQWSAAVPAAFDFLDRELPADVKKNMVGLRFDDDAIEISVAGPLAGLSAAYGEIRFDNWGAATDWLYPRDEPPGFGCSSGAPLWQLRQALEICCSEIDGCNPQAHFSIADYSCSSGQGGHWGLYLQSPP